MKEYLSTIPDELVVSIVNLIDDKNSLCALAQVSKRFQTLAEPVLYSNIELLSHKVCYCLKQAIEAEPRRAAYFEVLDLRPRSGRRSKEYGETISGVLSQCSRLRELTLEGPNCNDGRWREDPHGWQELESRIPPALMEALGSATTRGLVKLELHLNSYEDRYWDPNASQATTSSSWSTIMALPTLTDLTVSCAVIHDAIQTGIAKSSNLKSLKLIECNISMEGLSHILSTPKALEKLYLGENVHHMGDGTHIPRREVHATYNCLFARDPDTFVEALSQQKESLEQLTYITLPSRRSQPVGRQNFKNFPRLREVALSMFTQDLIKVLASDDSPPGMVSLHLESNPHYLFDGLVQLHQDIESSEPMLSPEDVSSRIAPKVSSILLPSFSSEALQQLQHLHLYFVYNTSGTHRIDLGLKRQWITCMNTQWQTHGVKLHLYWRLRNGGIIPPVLWGEEDRAPEDLLIFSSEEGFSEGVSTL